MKKSILLIIFLIIASGLYLIITKKSTRQEQITQSDQTKSITEEKISTTTLQSYKLEDVAKHNKAGDCWTTINGKVYDLTTWPEKHPGGDKAIFAICGIDGTKAYEKTHQNQEKPANVLDSFFIGNLSK